MPEAVKSYVATLTEAQIQQFHQRLAEAGWEFSDLQYGYWKARKAHTTVAAYRSGKTTIQGAGTAELVQFTLEPEILHEARMGYEGVLAEQEHPEQFQPHAGIDESGKGDFFGPLVVACCYTDHDAAKILLEGGVKDSKLITTDSGILKLSHLIRDTVHNHYAVVVIGPAAYNKLYREFGNVNRLLAWGHARALEDLLAKVPGCPRAISDQFGVGSLVHHALLEKGRKIVLDEHPKAEADIAVAAASILARAEYVLRMRALSAQAGLELPKGCGDAVLAAGREFLKLHPRAELGNYAKVSFKTTLQL